MSEKNSNYSMDKAIAIKIDYISPRTNKSIQERRVLTQLGNHKTHKVIETLQKKIMKGYVLDRLPSVTFQVCDNFVAAMIASCKL